MAKGTHIEWAANQYGYCVKVMAGGETLEAYRAGNHAAESTTVTHPSDPCAVPYRELRKFAKRTARDMAEEHGIAEIYISENTDILEDGNA